MAFDFTGGATGALSGAATGASIGGPIGGVAGGLIGGIAGLFGNKKKKKKTISSLDPNQQQLNQYQHQGVLGQGPLADLYNYDPEEANAVFDQNVANPAYRNLQEKGIPGITGQFRSQGLQNSSYAGDAIAKLTRDVQETLNGQRSQFLYGERKDSRNARRDAITNLQGNSTFAYDKSASNNNGFDINRILSSITPEMIDQGRNYFQKPTKF